MTRNRNNQSRRGNRRSRPAGRRPVSRVTYTSRLADFPPGVDAQLVTNQVVLNNLFIPQLANISSFYTEYRFSRLTFSFESVAGLQDGGRVFMMFDSRFNIQPPETIDDVYNRALWTSISVHRAPAVHRNGVRGQFSIPRSAYTQPWFRTAVDGGTPNPDDSIGVLFFGTDEGATGVIPGHLTVTATIELRN